MALLSASDLRVAIGDVPILRGISLDVAEGEALGIVGESGSGKSITARAMSRLLPAGAEVEGRVVFEGVSMLDADEQQLRGVRDKGMAMVFQDPRASINPVRKVGDFLIEAVCTNRGLDRAEARRRALEVLETVRISRAESRLDAYPHQLSGGLLQRVMIAAALLSDPRLMIADEPTTALDVTTQAEIMAILEELRAERGMALILITHDLELAAATTDRIAVMYAGEVVEFQGAAELIDDPQHPYTSALLAARPSIERRIDRLPAIPGRALPTGEEVSGCRFADRCPLVIERCRAEHPPLEPHADGLARCFRPGEVDDRLLARSS